MRRAGNETSELIDLIGLQLRYRVTPEASRLCLGRTERNAEGRDHVDCDRTATEGRRCQRCATVENVLAASMHQAHRLGRGAVDGRLAAHLDQPHRLYLATFRDGSLKVGTTAGATGGHRLLEQGAWFGRYVALADDGFVVRELEDLVTESLGVSQAVSSARKLGGLVRPRGDGELSARLDGAAADVDELLGLAERPGARALEAAWVNPGVGDEAWSHPVRYPSRLDAGTHDLAVVGAVGRLIAFRRPGFGEVFVSDLDPLFGLSLDVGDHEVDEVALQGALF